MNVCRRFGRRYVALRTVGETWLLCRGCGEMLSSKRGRLIVFCVELGGWEQNVVAANFRARAV